MDVDGKKIEEQNPPAATNGNWPGRYDDAVRAVKDLYSRINNRDWVAPDHKRVRIACDDAKLVAEFVARSRQRASVHPVIHTAMRQDKDFVEAFEKVSSTVRAFEVDLLAIARAGATDNMVDELAARANAMRQAIDKAIDAFVAVVNGRTAGNQQLARESEKAIHMAREIQSQIRAGRVLDEQARDATRQAAGDAAAHRLSEHFWAYAGQETKIANHLRLIVTGLLTSVAVGAIGLNALLGDLSLSTELVRLSAVIPLAALAAYLARESSKHRTSAKRASELAIAMRTLHDYTAPLEDPTKSDLRRVLGMRVFGSDTQNSATPEGDGLYDHVADVSHKFEDLVRRVLEIVEKWKKNQ